MKRIFLFIKNDRTVRANIVVVGGNFLANIGAYLYHLMMGIMLIPADYSILQSLISLSNILNVPLATLNNIIAKYISMYVGKNERKKISYFYHVAQKYSLITMMVGGVLFFILYRPILNFLHINSFTDFLILDLALFFGLVNIVNRATLQGLSLFFQLTVAQFIESYGKLIIGFIAVMLGFRVPGAYGAFVIVIFFSYVYMKFVIRQKVPISKERIVLPYKEIVRYSIPTMLMTISIVSLYNTDVVLVRHFFNASQSGLYSALSVLGKIIFFGSAPVTLAMFPLVSEAHAKGESFHKIFLTSLLFTVAIASVATLIFSFYPGLVLKTLRRTEYLEAAVYLSRFSIFISLCAVINLLANFFLSIRKSFPVYLVGVAAISQVVGISLFHQNIESVITTSLLVTSSLTILLLLYYVYITKH